MSFTTRTYSLIFLIVYYLYWLVSKLQNLYQTITRLIFHNNRNTQIQKLKTQQTLSKLQKIPKKVIIALEAENTEIKDNYKQIMENLVACMDVIRMAMVEELAIYVWGDQEGVKVIEDAIRLEESGLNQEQLILQNFLKKQAKTKIQFINFDTFHKNLTKQQIPTTQQTTPLIISMSKYNSLSCLPFTYLIDAEFAFCNPIDECLPIDVERCFQQYASSKQRKGR